MSDGGGGVTAMSITLISSSQDRPVLRWDNKEEFPHLATYPHHLHAHHGMVSISPLVGEPLRDLKIVLELLTEFLNAGI